MGCRVLAGRKLFILIRGNNLLRKDLKLRHRLSPDVCQEWVWSSK